VIYIVTTEDTNSYQCALHIVTTGGTYIVTTGGTYSCHCAVHIVATGTWRKDDYFRCINIFSFILGVRREFGADPRDWLVVQHSTGITNRRVEPKYSERYPRQRHFVHCTSHTTCPGIEADENGPVSRDSWDAVREQFLVVALLLDVNYHRLNLGQLTWVPHHVTSAVRWCCEETDHLSFAVCRTFLLKLSLGIATTYEVDGPGIKSR
jgi:hypothetical protein